MVAILSASFLGNISASALSDAEFDKFAQNDIYFYDPGNRSIYSGSFCNGNQTLDIKPTSVFNENAITVMGLMAQSGYSAPAIAGVLGNLAGENSTFEPGNVEYPYGDITDRGFRITEWERFGKNGFGIVQWTTAGRQTNLQNYADEHGGSLLELSIQIGFMMQELSGYNYSAEQSQNYSIEEATFIIYDKYEAPGSSFWIDHNDKHYNDYDPKTLDQISETQTPAAYAAYNTRLSYAYAAYNLITTNNIAAGNPAVDSLCNSNGGNIDYPAPTVSPDVKVGTIAEMVKDPANFTNVQCAPNTIDLGIYTNAHYKGEKISVRLCEIPNLDSSSDESKSITTSLGTVSAHRHAIVNSLVSGAFYEMVKYIKETYGWEITASTAFRSYEHQEQLWDRYGHNPNEAAKPGTSKHESGFAVDFDIPKSSSSIFEAKQLSSCEGVRFTWSERTDHRETDDGRKERWDSKHSEILCKVTPAYGLWRPLSNEVWHVQPIAG